jgi:hypothetical protein
MARGMQVRAMGPKPRFHAREKTEKDVIMAGYINKESYEKSKDL